jgi:hypothetical protein
MISSDCPAGRGQQVLAIGQHSPNRERTPDIHGDRRLISRDARSASSLMRSAHVELRQWIVIRPGVESTDDYAVGLAWPARELNEITDEPGLQAILGWQFAGRQMTAHGKRRR